MTEITTIQNCRAEIVQLTSQLPSLIEHAGGSAQRRDLEFFAA
jgi:hypothetical protein